MPTALARLEAAMPAPVAPPRPWAIASWAAGAVDLIISLTLMPAVAACTLILAKKLAICLVLVGEMPNWLRLMSMVERTSRLLTPSAIRAFTVSPSLSTAWSACSFEPVIWKRPVSPATLISSPYSLEVMKLSLVIFWASWPWKSMLSRLLMPPPMRLPEM